MSASVPTANLQQWAGDLDSLSKEILTMLPPENIKVSVKSVNESGTPILGYYVVFTDADGSEKTGYTPATFETTRRELNGKVTVSDFGDAKFTKWSDGTTSRTKTVSLKADVLLTAVYQVGTPVTPAPPPPSGSAKAGTIVPLYTYPSNGGNTATWNIVADSKKLNPTVPIIAVVNPASGVGRLGKRGGGLWYSTLASRPKNKMRSLDMDRIEREALKTVSDPDFKMKAERGSFKAISSDYANGIKRLQAAGVKVLGYVSTNYGNRSASSIMAEVDTWYSWYPTIDGIFWDEQPNWGGWETHYKNLTAHVKAKKSTAITIGNPGADSIPSYLNTVDIVLIYESPNLPSLGNFSTKWGAYDNWKLGMIPFGVGSLPTQWVRDASAFVGWIYVTHDVLSNPWDSVSSYFRQLVSLIASL